MTTWFTGDEHFTHANIIKYCKRPFASVEEMNAAIIERHNARVKDGDVVYHLGDFVFKNTVKGYAAKLNGSHIFIRGNHDKDRLSGILEITIEKQRIVLCHYAMRVWNASHYGAWQLYGHSHGTLPPIGKQYDVGVDNNNFAPISFEELREKLKDVPIHNPIKREEK